MTKRRSPYDASTDGPPEYSIVFNTPSSAAARIDNAAKQIVNTAPRTKTRAKRWWRLLIAPMRRLPSFSSEDIRIAENVKANLTSACLRHLEARRCADTCPDGCVDIYEHSNST